MMDDFAEESAPGGSETLQVKELEAFQAEILSKLTASTLSGRKTAVLPLNQPVFTLNSIDQPPGAVDAGWGFSEVQGIPPEQHKRPDIVPQEALNRMGAKTEPPDQRDSSDNTTRRSNHKQHNCQQAWLSPNSISILAPSHPVVATPSHTRMTSTQTMLTTPTYPAVSPPTKYSVATPTQSVVAPPHQHALKESAARVNLVEKHAKHISDLQAYYEGEMKKLREQVSLLEQHTASSEQSWPQWRAMVGTPGRTVRSPVHTHSPSLFGSPAKMALKFPSSPLKPGLVVTWCR